MGQEDNTLDRISDWAYSLNSLARTANLLLFLYEATNKNPSKNMLVATGAGVVVSTVASLLLNRYYNGQLEERVQDETCITNGGKR